MAACAALLGTFHCTTRSRLPVCALAQAPALTSCAAWQVPPKMAAERTVPIMTANIDKKTRRMVYQRDGWRCALCDSTDGLQIHHVWARGRGGSRTNPMNMIALCWRCHAAAHGSIMALDNYAMAAVPGATTDDRIRGMMDMMEQECVQYLADYYAEQGVIWYPF